MDEADQENSMPTGEYYENAGASESAVETVAQLLAETDPDDVVYVVSPPEWTVRATIGAAAMTGESSPTIRIVGDGRVLRRVRRDFLTASEAASLVEDGTLEFREDPPEETNRAIVTSDGVYAVIAAGGHARLLADDDETMRTAALEAAEEAWEAAEPFNLRTPGIDRVSETMREEFGATFSQQFTEGLDVARGMRDRTEFDPVAASLLVAAHNDELHYDVSRLGEDLGLGSRATYSRIKSQLEDDGIITTEKVKVQMGRPRQRLHLADQYSQIADDRGVTDLIGHILT